MISAQHKKTTATRYGRRLGTWHQLHLVEMEVALFTLVSKDSSDEGNANQRLLLHFRERVLALSSTLWASSDGEHIEANGKNGNEMNENERSVGLG